MTFRALRKCVNMGDDDHTDATAEPGFADTSEPCAEAENKDFCDRVASFFREMSIADC